MLSSPRRVDLPDPRSLFALLEELSGNIFVQVSEVPLLG